VELIGWGRTDPFAIPETQSPGLLEVSVNWRTRGATNFVGSDFCLAPFAKEKEIGTR